MCSFSDFAVIGNFDQTYQTLIRGNSAFMEDLKDYPNLRRCICLTPAAINMAIKGNAIILGHGNPTLICSDSGKKSDGGPAVWGKATEKLTSYILSTTGGNEYAKLAANQLAVYIVGEYLKALPSWPTTNETNSCVVSLQGQGGKYSIEGGQQVRWNATGNITCTDKSEGDKWTASIAGIPQFNFMILDFLNLKALEGKLVNLGITSASDEAVKRGLEAKFNPSALESIQFF